MTIPPYLLFFAGQLVVSLAVFIWKNPVPPIVVAKFLANIKYIILAVVLAVVGWLAYGKYESFADGLRTKGYEQAVADMEPTIAALKTEVETANAEKKACLAREESAVQVKKEEGISNAARTAVEKITAIEKKNVQSQIQTVGGKAPDPSVGAPGHDLVDPAIVRVLNEARSAHNHDLRAP